MTRTLAQKDPRALANEKRLLRFRVHHWQASHSERKSAAWCMHTAAGSGGVELSLTRDGVVHVAGVQRCASVAACAVCAPVIRERRADEIDQAVGEALARGMCVYFVTATVAHQLGDHLSDVWKLVTGAWSKTFSGRSSMRWREATGYVGQIRVIEATYGQNGWHPHIHALLIFDRPVELLSLGVTYGAHVAKAGGRAIVGTGFSPGWNVSPVVKADDVSQYLAKVEGGWGAGLELARVDLKSARRGGLTATALLVRAADGCPDSARLWAIYERATIGRRMFAWSRGLHELLGVVEVDDDQAATVECDATTVVKSWWIPAHEWSEIVRSGALGAVLNLYGRYRAPVPDHLHGGPVRFGLVDVT